MRRVGSPSSQSGFSYIGLLITVAIIGAISAATLTAGAAMQRGAAEEDLLFIGAQFQDAFKSYYESTPPGATPYPKTLDELLLDRRFASPKRHLRKIFPDPMTGNFDWGLVRGSGGTIMAVYSHSASVPIKLTGFTERFASFEGLRSYSDWQFSYAPESFPNTR